jgi:hypothetical protein
MIAFMFEDEARRCEEMAAKIRKLSRLNERSKRDWVTSPVVV